MEVDATVDFSDEDGELEDEPILLERPFNFFFISPSLHALLSSIPILNELTFVGIIQLHNKPNKGRENVTNFIS